MLVPEGTSLADGRTTFADAAMALYAQHGMLLFAILDGEKVVLNPGASRILRAGDIAFVIAARQDFAAHFHTLGLRVGHRPSAPQIRSQRLCIRE